MTQAELDKEINDLQVEYRKAVYRESAIREVAFLPMDLDICGIKVKQFTPKHYIFLDFLGSPFVGGKGEIDAGRIAEFLWIVSAEYEDEAPEKKEEFIKRLANVDAETALSEISNYVKDAFSDLTASSGDKAEAETQTPYYAWICSYIDMLGAEYGYRDDYVLNMPLARIFQLARVIEVRKAIQLGKEPFLVNNLSDNAKVKLRALLKQKAEMNKEVTN
jgi:hypothetical protein